VYKRQVIAYGSGGVLDTVIPGETGEFFAEQSVDCLAETLKTFRPGAYDPAKVRAHAESFDASVFRRRINEFVAARLEDYRAGIPTSERGM